MKIAYTFFRRHSLQAARFAAGLAMSGWLLASAGNPAAAQTSSPYQPSYANIYSGVGGYYDYSSAGQNPSSVRSLKLGTFVTNTDRGALVQNVEPNSAAARAGLERDDLIITINGSQVGYVLGNLVDVGDTANRLATNNRVVALVAHRNTGRLENINIDLQPAASIVRMSIRTPGNESLNNARLMVVVQNVSRPVFQVDGGRLDRSISGRGPFDIELQLSPATISPSDKYEAAIEISDRNNVPLYSARVPLDLNNGQPISQTVTLQPYGNLAGGPSPRQSGYGTVGTSITLDQQVSSIFTTVFGRPPDSRELPAWVEYASTAKTVDDLKIALLSTRQYYDLMNNDPQAFVAGAYSQLAGRAADANEFRRWLTRFGQLQGNRQALLNEIVAAMSRR